MRIFLLAVLATAGTWSWAEPVRATGEYNLNNGVGLLGFDPVSFFPEGGGVPAQGVEAIGHLGVSYLFSSPERKALFLADPDKYEPTYGGWCAWAMAHGSKVEIQTQFYIIDGRRIHFFVSARARDNFKRDVARYTAEADRNWRRISGEEPRL